MFVVGLTGGIGSGKTTIGKLFQSHNVVVIDADDIARAVVAIGEPALDQIAARFGNDILQADGSLNRAALRQTIFTDPAQKQWLEALTHPLIAQKTQDLIGTAQSPYVIYISPLMIELGTAPFIKRVLVIDCPETHQLERTIIRDNNAAELVSAIMNNQCTREQRLAKADDIINNAGDQSDLAQQVTRLHNHYLNLVNTPC